MNTLAKTVSFGEGAYLIDLCLSLMGSEDLNSKIFNGKWSDYESIQEPDFETAGGLNIPVE